MPSIMRCNILLHWMVIIVCVGPLTVYTKIMKSASTQKWLRQLFWNKLTQGAVEMTKENEERIKFTLSVRHMPVHYYINCRQFFFFFNLTKNCRRQAWFLTIKHWNTSPSRAFIVWALNYCSCLFGIKISFQILSKDITLFYMILCYDQKQSHIVTVL